MQDPTPENITGSKIQKHTFEHQIRWDLLIAAVVAGFVAWKLFGGLSLGSDSESDENVRTEKFGELSDSAEAIWVE
jgi:hypothetical protein